MLAFSFVTAENFVNAFEIMSVSNSMVCDTVKKNHHTGGKIREKKNFFHANITTDMLFIRKIIPSLLFQKQNVSDCMLRLS